MTGGKDLSVAVDGSDPYQTRLHGSSLLVDLQLVEVRSMGGVLRLAPTHLELDFNGTRWMMVADKDRTTIFHRETAVLQLSSPDHDERHHYQLSIAGDLALRDVLIEPAGVSKARADLCSAGHSAVCGSGAVSLVSLLQALSEAVLSSPATAMTKGKASAETQQPQLESLEKKLDQESARLAAMSSMLSDLQSKVNELRLDRDRASPLNRRTTQTQQQQQHQQQPDLANIRAEFAVEMRAVEDQMVQAESKLKAQVAAAEGRLAQLSDEVRALRQRLLDLDTSLELVETRQNLSTSLALEKLSISTAAIRSQVADCGTLQTEVERMQSKITSLDASLRAVREQMEISPPRHVVRDNEGRDAIIDRLSVIELSLNASAERVLSEARLMKTELIHEIRHQTQASEMAELRRVVERQARQIEALEAAKSNCASRSELADLRALLLRA